jgi:hypothetical protein
MPGGYVCGQAEEDNNGTVSPVWVLFRGRELWLLPGFLREDWNIFCDFSPSLSLFLSSSLVGSVGYKLGLWRGLVSANQIEIKMVRMA